MTAPVTVASIEAEVDSYLAEVNALQDADAAFHATDGGTVCAIDVTGLTPPPSALPLSTAVSALIALPPLLAGSAVHTADTLPAASTAAPPHFIASTTTPPPRPSPNIVTPPHTTANATATVRRRKRSRRHKRASTPEAEPGPAAAVVAAEVAAEAAAEVAAEPGLDAVGLVGSPVVLGAGQQQQYYWNDATPDSEVRVMRLEVVRSLTPISIEALGGSLSLCANYKFRSHLHALGAESAVAVDDTLLDTGAKRSCISQALAKQLIDHKAASLSNLIELQHPRTLKGYDSSAADRVVRQCLSLVVDTAASDNSAPFRAVITFLVVPNLAHPLIIGRDLLSDYCYTATSQESGGVVYEFTPHALLPADDAIYVIDDSMPDFAVI